jgi:sortase A
VAQLSVPELGIEQYVLAGTNGAALPFGPGHMDGTALPGEPGSMVIAAHRDTHFRFLGELQAGALIRVRGMHGSDQWFSVIDQAIVDASRYGIVPAAGTAELVLVTCQPTDALRFRGPLRLVVTAVPAKPPARKPKPCNSHSAKAHERCTRA